jgi:hypothetical protein
MVNGFSAVCHDDERSFAAEIVDQELEEGVDGESLKCVSNRRRDGKAMCVPRRYLE